MKYVFIIMMIVLCLYTANLSSVNDATYKDFDFLFIEPMDLKIGWTMGIGFTISFAVGFGLAAISWYFERKKRRIAEKDIVGLKDKLKKVEREREFQEKKMLLLEDTIKLPSSKVSTPPKKVRKTFLGIPIK